ncbi:hypothetical protein H6F43_08775 [Leptolyngbya sp. FACHB-36]|uniref:hypothetical protein n=1 Tax=Leptolyngbya sp. FACHB-36 TaxID=2692808 RepID=UPI0016807863|nr:hypothetical protein [Leptolyngbya sp. FACHB-36]MBD2020278.1 hypothetical protein [Leptolyngbya sp. FACHB-36]
MRLKLLVTLAALFIYLISPQPAAAESDLNILRSPDAIQVMQPLNPRQAPLPNAASNGASQTRKTWGQCFNLTNRTLAVYGKSTDSKKKAQEAGESHTLYFLASGQATDDEWDCDGVYIPAEIPVAGLEPADGQERGPIVARIVDGARFMVMASPTTAELEFNVSPAQIIKSGESTWEVPNLTQTLIDRQFPDAPIDD